MQTPLCVAVFAAAVIPAFFKALVWATYPLVHALFQYITIIFTCTVIKPAAEILLFVAE
jgi:hypothetical protein